MERFCFPHCASIYAVVKENDERASPVPTDWKWIAPTARTFHLVSREVKCVDLRLRQVMPSGDITLQLLLGKFRERLDHVLFPRPKTTQLASASEPCSPSAPGLFRAA